MSTKINSCFKSIPRIILTLFLILVPTLVVLVYYVEKSIDTGEEQFRDCLDCNVVVVLIDALRYDHLGCYGYEKDISKNIDVICEGAFVFENAIAQSTWTKPSVASLFTSNYLQEHETAFFTDNESEDAEKNVLPSSAITIAEVLSSQGYKTKAVLGNMYIKQGFGLEQGFDEYDFLGGRIIDNVITSKALDWIKKNKGGRFFLYVHYMAPHCPYGPPPEYRERLKSDYTGKIDFEDNCQNDFENINLSEEDIEELIWRYDREINYVDDEVGRLVGYLRDEGILDNTILVVTSDHGEALGEKKFGHGHLLNVVVQVPLIILHPHNKDPVRISSIVELIDVSPTILSQLNISIPETFAGQDILNIDEEKAETRFGFSETNKGEIGIRSRKYFFKKDPQERGGKHKIYDITLDPYELEDITVDDSITQDFLKKAALYEKMDKEMVESKKIDKETIRRLKEIGYMK